MNIQLSRPIVFLDLETTGLSLTQDRIVEIAMLKVSPDGTSIKKRKLINPEKPIPAEIIAIHGITNEMVKDAPTFKQAANDKSNKFDWPLLMEEFLKAGMEFDILGRKLLDVQKIYHLMEPRNLAAAYKFYCNQLLENAHSAEADVNATWEVFEAQLQKYDKLGNTIESVLQYIGEDEIVDFARRIIIENGKEVFNFGKHKGKRVEDVLKNEPSYYDWMMKSDFAMHTKQKLTEIFNRTLLKQRN